MFFYFLKNDLCILDLGREAGNVFAEFDVLALCFIQKGGHTLQLNLQTDRQTDTRTQIAVESEYMDI